MHLLRLCLALALGLAAWAQGPLRIAAAADLRGPLEELAAAFTRAGGGPVEPTYGASGALSAQIAQGAPFGLFLSADLDSPARLKAQGLGTGEVFPYASGRLALWVSRGAGLAQVAGLEALKAPAVKRVALANPALAPYGRTAEAALRQAGLLPLLQPKLVFGNNVAQAAQFARTGSMEAALLSFSQARHPELASRGLVWVLPEGSHPPLRQGGLLLSRPEQAKAAAAFRGFLLSPEGQAILVRHGFGRP
jgi:molybdate transport system substrate-binding protein